MVVNVVLAGELPYLFCDLSQSAKILVNFSYPPPLLLNPANNPHPLFSPARLFQPHHVLRPAVDRPGAVHEADHQEDHRPARRVGEGQFMDWQELGLS